ncbi:hypothetical protein GDO81_017478 [Engystomops pustulosus]|uniref:C-type lectin domain-containing protein n=1 Tax=Engystomops pustulosus TaxID=76066 RepID=A0AAV7AIH6_ENGPU|nr:hypothetical protein GDO81_017478 [Engystomops pustulosus]
MRRTLCYHDAEVSNGPTRTALLLCLCSALGSAAAQSVPGQEAECPAPLWVQFRNRCYTFVHVTQSNLLSIELGRELCKDIGADIISISSQEENSFLVEMFKTKWKGPTEIFLGMFFDSDDNSLKWYDKSEVTFVNWGKIQLSDNNLDTCVKMDTQSGRWDITDCDGFTESSVLCKYEPKENHTIDKKAVMITLIMTFITIALVLSIVVILLHKRRSALHRAELLPYSDDAVLVDTMEREDYA